MVAGDWRSPQGKKRDKVSFITKMPHWKTDTVNSITYTLGANVENLTLIGAAVINCMGKNLNNIIEGDRLYIA